MIPSDIAAPTPVAAATGADSASLGQEDFLRMLITQLENQDPLDPQDSTEFTAQLAQFSSLEQLVAMREAIDDLSAAQSSGTNLDGVSLVGREVLLESSTFSVTEDGEAPILSFELDSATRVESVDIYDANGFKKGTAELSGLLSAGVHQVDISALDLPEDVYSFQVTLDPESTSRATPLVQARVTGASIGESDPVLFFGDAVGLLSGVREVRP